MNRPHLNLYELLPAVYRLRDADQGHVLRALLGVMQEQLDVVRDDIRQGYENWFIETCQEWVVPYIGDLVGHRRRRDAEEPGDAVDPHGASRQRFMTPRREIANVVQSRRRKGTLAVLEQLAADVAGWPARAVEFYKLLAWTQNLNHQRPQQGRYADLRDAGALDLVDTPFDPLAHNVDVRRIDACRSPGRYNLPNVGLFVFRLRSFPVTRTPAGCLHHRTVRYYTFSALGNDAPLFTKPEPEAVPTDIAGELNLPIPIRPLALFDRAPDGRPRISARYYGPAKSLAIWKKGPGATEPRLIPQRCIVPADLGDDHLRYPPPGRVYVDPRLGRIVVGERSARDEISVSYHYGFSAEMGSGQYPRKLAPLGDNRPISVGNGESLNDKVKGMGNTAGIATVIDITESGTYDLDPKHIVLGEGQKLHIRARSGVRPVVSLTGSQGHCGDESAASCAPDSCLVLDGLLIHGQTLQINLPAAQKSGASLEPARIVIRHCTLVPGGTGAHGCEGCTHQASLRLTGPAGHVAIEHSIVGAIEHSAGHDGAGEALLGPLSIRISDSILDGAGHGGSAFLGPAARLSVLRSTVVGAVEVQEIDLAENSIFADFVRVHRCQRGCLRFSYVHPNSKTPPRYNCQPDAAEAAAPKKACGGAGEPSPEEGKPVLPAVQVRPQFESTHYGTPDYCQLAVGCDEAITRGADDESEMGAFHDLFQPQRAANLRARLAEYTPAEASAAIIYAKSIRRDGGTKP